MFSSNSLTRRRTAHLAIAALFTLAAAACSHRGPDDSARWPGWLSDKPLTAFTFLSVECPLSQNYTGQLNALNREYGEGVGFVGVFPLVDDDAERVQAFQDKYELGFVTRLDHGYELVDMLHPSVTPEVFLVDRNGKTIYSGKIDDWAVALGRTRSTATERYLEDAIRATQSDETVAIRRVEPVGCFLPEKPHGEDSRAQ